MSENIRRKVRETKDALNRMVAKIDPSLAKIAPVHVRQLKKAEIGEHEIDVRVTFAFPVSLSEPPPPAHLALAEAVYKTFSTNLTPNTLVGGMGHAFDCRIDDLHGSVVGDSITFAQSFRKHYDALLPKDKKR